MELDKLQFPCWVHLSPIQPTGSTASEEWPLQAMMGLEDDSFRQIFGGF